MKHIELIKHFGKRTKKEKEYLDKVSLNIPFLYQKRIRCYSYRNTFINFLIIR